jgi:hypothetical protein
VTDPHRALDIGRVGVGGTVCRARPALRRVFVAGEVLRPAVAKRWRNGLEMEPPPSLLRLTEMTMIKLFHEWQTTCCDRPFRLGRPMDGAGF